MRCSDVIGAEVEFHRSCTDLKEIDGVSQDAYVRLVEACRKALEKLTHAHRAMQPEDWERLPGLRRAFQTIPYIDIEKLGS